MERGGGVGELLFPASTFGSFPSVLSFLLPPEWSFTAPEVEEGKGSGGGKGQKKKFESDFLSSFHFLSLSFLSFFSLVSS